MTGSPTHKPTDTHKHTQTAYKPPVRVTGLLESERQSDWLSKTPDCPVCLFRWENRTPLFQSNCVLILLMKNISFNVLVEMLGWENGPLMLPRVHSYFFLCVMWCVSSLIKKISIDRGKRKYVCFICLCVEQETGLRILCFRAMSGHSGQLL